MATLLPSLRRLVDVEVASYQPYWVTLAHALGAAGDARSAGQALRTAMGLTEDPAIRSFLAKSLRRSS